MKKDKVINIILTFGCLVLLSVIGFGAYVALRPMFLPANAASTESDFKRDNGGEGTGASSTEEITEAVTEAPSTEIVTEAATEPVTEAPTESRRK